MILVNLIILSSKIQNKHLIYNMFNMGTNNTKIILLIFNKY